MPFVTHCGSKLKFLMDDFIFEAWGHFLNSYWQQRGRPNVLFMTYEEMKKDLPGTVQRIAALWECH